jgi:tetratricopeptide (TPR) repeat protein
MMLIIPQLTFGQFRKKSAYNLISKEEYNKRLLKKKEVVLNKYIVVPSFLKNADDKFTSSNNTDTIVMSAATSLKHGRVRFVRKYLENNNKDTGIFALVYGLYLINKGKYAEALIHLNNCNTTSYKSLVLLLSADCRYECLSDKSQYEEIIPFYQQALDASTDLQFRDIVLNRFRFVRYNPVFQE